MHGLTEAFRTFASDKDFESFQIGYGCRQEHIDILHEEIAELKVNKEFYEKKKAIIKSLERLFNSFLKHENSECGHCLFCDNMWQIIDMIEDKLEELKG